MTTKWTKYSYVCQGCDSLFEITCQDPKTYEPQCCGYMVNVSVVDATIYPTTTKEETMETTTYLQSQIDELKKQLSSHQNCDYWKSENGRIQRQLIDVINSAYENDADASEILESVCEIIDYNPTKTVQFEGVIHFSGAIDIPMNEVADFDLTSALEDVYVDINNGDIVIDNYELYSVEESY